MLLRGYQAVTVDELCAIAGVSKGAFFHHFPSKEAFAAEALGHYRARLSAALAQAPFQSMADPVARLTAYAAFLGTLLQDEAIPNACMFGNLSQEAAPTSEVVRMACDEGLSWWAAEVASDLRAAAAAHPTQPGFDADSLGRYFVAVYEGALVLSKAFADRGVIQQCLAHLARYIESQFEESHFEQPGERPEDREQDGGQDRTTGGRGRGRGTRVGSPRRLAER